MTTNQQRIILALVVAIIAMASFLAGTAVNQHDTIPEDSAIYHVHDNGYTSIWNPQKYHDYVELYEPELYDHIGRLIGNNYGEG